MAPLVITELLRQRSSRWLRRWLPQGPPLERTKSLVAASTPPRSRLRAAVKRGPARKPFSFLLSRSHRSASHWQMLIWTKHCSVGICMCVCMHVCWLLSHVQLFATLWTVAPLSMSSPGKNSGVGCHSPLQGIFPTQGSNPGLLHCRWTLPLSHQGSPQREYSNCNFWLRNFARF